MSLRARILGLVEILLRVPPLFVVDEILKIGLGLSEITEYDLNELQHRPQADQGPGYAGFNSSAPVQYDPTFYKFVIMALVRLLVNTCGEYLGLESFGRRLGGQGLGAISGGGPGLGCTTATTGCQKKETIEVHEGRPLALITLTKSQWALIHCMIEKILMELVSKLSIVEKENLKDRSY